MFNMFRKKEQESFGLKNTEKYTPAFLPKNVEDGHTDLSTFIVGDYSLLNDAFLAARYAECESKLSPLVQISDEFTLGDMGDSYVNAEWEFVKNKHEEEVAIEYFCEYYCANLEQDNLRQKLITMIENDL